METILETAIVIDRHGIMVDLVAVKDDEVYYYELKEGETLVHEQLDVASVMVKPRWNGTGWEETASEKEIEARMPKADPYDELRAIDDRLRDAMFREWLDTRMGVSVPAMAMAAALVDVDGGLSSGDFGIDALIARRTEIVKELPGPGKTRGHPHVASSKEA